MKIIVCWPPPFLATEVGRLIGLGGGCIAGRLDEMENRVLKGLRSGWVPGCRRVRHTHHFGALWSLAGWCAVRTLQ
jgi:hypothetical protein